MLTWVGRLGDRTSRRGLLESVDAVAVLRWVPDVSKRIYSMLVRHRLVTYLVEGVHQMHRGRLWTMKYEEREMRVRFPREDEPKIRIDTAAASPDQNENAKFDPSTPLNMRIQWPSIRCKITVIPQPDSRFETISMFFLASALCMPKFSAQHTESPGIEMRTNKRRSTNQLLKVK